MPIIFPRYPKVVLTGDADPGNVMLGKTFYKDDYKQKLTGTYVPAAPPVLDGDAGPGDVLQGKTFYKDDAYTKLTGTIPSKAAATITPGTTNQVIASGQYLSGAQTIAGDANLVPANIVSGKNIFGVAGNYTEPTAITSGDNIYLNASQEDSGVFSSMTKIKEIQLYVRGTFKVLFSLRSVQTGQTVYAQIFINDVAKGIMHTSSAASYEVIEESFTVLPGDLIQLYVKTASQYYSVYVKDFKICGAIDNSKVGLITLN